MQSGRRRLNRRGSACIAAVVLVLSLGCVAAGQAFLLPIQFQFQLPHAMFATSLTDLSLVIGKEQTFFVKEYKAHWRNWDSTLNLRFAWTTTQPGVASAIYQVTTVPYPADPAHVLDPPGLVETGSAGSPPASAERRIFSIDLRSFAPVPPGETRPSSPSGSTAVSPTIGPMVRIAPGLAPAVRAMPGLVKESSPPSNVLSLVWYYVRVVTLDGNGKPVGVPSPPVRILFGELPEDEGASVSYHGQETLHHPSVRLTAYTPIQKEDPQAMYHYIVIRDIYLPVFGTLYYKGQPVDFTPQQDDPGFWESLWESLGALYASIGDFFRSAVNWCATAYEDIKGYAIEAAVVVAGEDARGLLTVGLELGLAAMGIPPSIPNYDELTSLGKDYMIQAAADYTGLPPEATEAAVNALIEEASRQANGGGNPDIWFKPDPAYAYRPSFFDLVARNPTLEPTDPVFARIKVQVPAQGNAELFHASYAYIPELLPGSSLSVRVYLEENYALRDPNQQFGGESYYAGMHRFWDYYNQYSATVSVITTGSPNTANPTQGQQQVTVYDCRYAQSL